MVKISQGFSTNTILAHSDRMIYFRENLNKFSAEHYDSWSVYEGRPSHPLFQFRMNLTLYNTRACRSMSLTLMHKNVHISLNIDDSTTKLVSFEHFAHFEDYFSSCCTSENLECSIQKAYIWIFPQCMHLSTYLHLLFPQVRTQNTYLWSVNIFWDSNQTQTRMLISIVSHHLHLLVLNTICLCPWRLKKCAIFSIILSSCENCNTQIWKILILLAIRSFWGATCLRYDQN